MAEKFNPYAEWLNVQCPAAQPNHYELLRLEPFESNPDAILTAANSQMAKVRGIRPGEHAEEWRRLLDELNAAKRCLTELIEKSQYDATLREQGWPRTSATSTTSSIGHPADAGRMDAKRSPYMEVTDVVTSNPLPPQLGGGKMPGPKSSGDAASGSAAGGNMVGGNVGSGAPTNVSAWQPGTNLLPPTSRVTPQAPAQTQGGASENGWIPPATSDKAWTPPSPQSPKAPLPPAAPMANSAPTAPPPAVSSTPPSPPAPKPKLQFPGETVPTAAPPAPPPPAPVPPTSAPAFLALGFPTPGFPTPAAGFPAAMPQPGAAFNQFPRPFPSAPMPGMMPQGAFPLTAAPPGAVPQQPFAGQFFPGGPMPPGVNPQFQQFPPGTPGMPNYFPHPPAAPNPYAQAPMPPPGGMPGYYPQQNAMPGFGGGYPPQPMPPQAMMAPAAAPQAASPVGGGNFLDDVLSGPSRGRSPMEELGFADSSAAPQPAGGWQPDNFAQPASVAPDPGGFGQATPPPFSGDYEPSDVEASPRTRAAARPAQGSRTMLIGGAFAAIVLLAAALIAVVVFKQKEPAVAINEPRENTSDESANNSQHPSPVKPVVAPVTKGPAAPTAVDPNHLSPTGTLPNDPATKTPTLSHPDNTPSTSPPTHPTVLVVPTTTPDLVKPTPPKPAAIDPAKSARLNHLLIDIRRKLAERNQEEANRLMAEAQPLAATPEQTDRVQRMTALVRYVKEFWGAVHDALGGLKATDEIDIGDDKAVVVDKDEQSLTIRMAGGNHHISLRDMPGGLAVALANRWLDPSKPENKVFIGAFYAVDPKHGPDDARQLWTEAAKAGVSDGTYLLPLLNPEPVETETTGAEMDALPPVPDPQAVDRVTLKVKEEFDEAIIAASTPTKLGELIQKLFDAEESSDDPVRKYVLLITARDTAAKAGRAKLTIDAIDQIAKNFRVDALDMKADEFSNYPPTTASGGREVTRAALALIDEAVAVKRLAVASRFAQVAVAAAQVSKGNDLIRRAMQRSKEIEALASKKMASDPQ